MDIELRLREIMTAEDPGVQVTNAVMSRVEGQDIPGRSGARVYSISQGRARRSRFVLVGAFVTVAAAAAAGMFVQHGGWTSKAPLLVAVAPAATVPDPVAMNSSVAAEKSDNVVADEVAVGQRDVAEAPRDAYLEAMRNPDAPITDHEAFRDSWRARAEKNDIDALLAAGFSLERIQWLRHRSDELKAQQKAELERGSSGLDVDPMSGAYIFDLDLRLADEIGVDEYERYRKALGRPLGAKIREIPINAATANVGLRPGDEIVAIGGKRVFNFFQLNVFQRQSSSSQITLDIRRNGVQFRVVVPNEALGINFEDVRIFTFGMNSMNSMNTMKLNTGG